MNTILVLLTWGLYIGITVGDGNDNSYPIDEQCLKWSMQERVDRIGNCSLGMNPRCFKVPSNDTCKKTIICNLTGTISDYSNFWPRNESTMSVLEYFTYVCTDICTLIRESVPLPGAKEWLGETRFDATITNGYGRVLTYRGIRPRDEVYATEIMYALPNEVRYINVTTKLRRCRDERPGYTTTLFYQCDRYNNLTDACSWQDWTSQCVTEVLACQNTTVCDLSEMNRLSWADACSFLCYLQRVTVGNDTQQYDFKVRYRVDHGGYTYNKRYDVPRGSAKRMLHLELYTRLTRRNVSSVSFTAVRRECALNLANDTQKCDRLKFYMQYGEMLTEGQMLQGCNRFVSPFFVENCTARLECRIRPNITTHEYCAVLLWMYKKSLEWSNIRLKRSTADTFMYLKFIGDQEEFRSVSCSAIPLRDTYEAFYRSTMDMYGRVDKVKLITRIDRCLPASEGKARIFHERPRLCRHARRRFDSSNASRLFPRMMHNCEEQQHQTETCVKTITCRRNSEDLYSVCNWLMWMIFKALYWPNYPQIKKWRDHGLVNLTILIDHDGNGSYTEEAELKPVQIGGAIPFIENFIYSHSFKGVRFRSKIDMCRSYVNGSRSLEFERTGWCDEQQAMVARHEDIWPPIRSQCYDNYDTYLCRMSLNQGAEDRAETASQCCPKTLICLLPYGSDWGLHKLCVVTGWLYTQMMGWTETLAHRHNITNPIRINVTLTTQDLNTWDLKEILRFSTSQWGGFIRIAQAMIQYGRWDHKFLLRGQLSNCQSSSNNPDL